MYLCHEADSNDKKRCDGDDDKSELPSLGETQAVTRDEGGHPLDEGGVLITDTSVDLGYITG